MDCPICNKTGISNELRLCPVCGTDLELFTYIHKMEKSTGSLKFKSKLFLIIVFLLILVMGAFVSIYMFKPSMLQLAGGHTSDVETKMLKGQNESIKKELDSLKNIISSNTKVDESDDGTDYAQPASESEKESNVPKKSEIKKEFKTVSTIKSPDIKSEKAEIKKVSTGSGNYKLHTVQEGETLYRIAVNFYGDGSKSKKILSDNNLSDPTKVKAGQELKIYNANN